MKNSKRIERNAYFMGIAVATAKRGTCNRAQVGAVAVRNKHIVATGYNGSPPGLPHCDDDGHHMINDHCVRTVHAEQNIITQCAKEGASLNEAIIYTTHEPCFDCLKLMISAGVDMVLYKHARRDIRTPLNFYRHIEIYQLDGDKLLDPLTTDKDLSDYSEKAVPELSYEEGKKIVDCAETEHVRDKTPKKRR